LRIDPRWSDGKPHNTSDATERVVIARVSAVIAAGVATTIVVAAVITAAVGAVSSLLLDLAAHELGPRSSE
jgi:hypothetical protein